MELSESLTEFGRESDPRVAEAAYQALTQDPRYRTLIQDHLIGLCLAAFQDANPPQRAGLSPAQLEHLFLAILLVNAHGCCSGRDLFGVGSLSEPRRKRIVASAEFLESSLDELDATTQLIIRKDEFRESLALLRVLLQPPKMRKDDHRHHRSWITGFVVSLQSEFGLGTPELLPIVKNFAALVGANVSDTTLARYVAPMATSPRGRGQ